MINAIRPYKGFSNIRMFLSDSNSNYNSLQSFLSKRKGNLVTSRQLYLVALAGGFEQRYPERR